MWPDRYYLIIHSLKRLALTNLGGAGEKFKFQHQSGINVIYPEQRLNSKTIDY